MLFEYWLKEAIFTKNNPVRGDSSPSKTRTCGSIPVIRKPLISQRRSTIGSIPVIRKPLTSQRRPSLWFDSFKTGSHSLRRGGHSLRLGGLSRRSTLHDLLSWTNLTIHLTNSSHELISWPSGDSIPSRIGSHPNRSGGHTLWTGGLSWISWPSEENSWPWISWEPSVQFTHD